MYHGNQAQFRDAASAQASGVDVSIVMPCLDEAQSLPHCIANAHEALRRIAAEHGLAGEIIVADNGSTDGSQAMARMLGARVVPVPVRGYGAALIGGCHGARGRFILMGDCDGSYDFTDGVAMIGALVQGHALCMGSRFAGGIAPGAMPWKNRHIGNPVLTGILNLFFRAGIDDAHCGLRAIRKESFLRLKLSGTGMEFASEMVIKAALLKLPIAQAPATLSADLRERAPHLRPWRDGWRHLRYLLMLSPTWAFGIPAAAAILASLAIFAVALLHVLGLIAGAGPFGTSWMIAAGFLFTTGHLAFILGLTTHFHGVRQGFRPVRPLLLGLADWLTLETMLISGIVAILSAIAAFAVIGLYWSGLDFAALPTTLPIVGAAVIGSTGVQNILGGFLLAITAGNDARFSPQPDRIDETTPGRIVQRG